MAERPGSSNAPVVAIVVLVVIIIVLLFIFHPWDEGPRIIDREKSETIVPEGRGANPSAPKQLQFQEDKSRGIDKERGQSLEKDTE